MSRIDLSVALAIPYQICYHYQAIAITEFVDILNSVLKFDPFRKLAIIRLYPSKVKSIPEADRAKQVGLSFHEIEQRRLSQIISPKGHWVILRGKDGSGIGFECIAQEFNLISCGNRYDHICDDIATADRMDSQIYDQPIAREKDFIHEIDLGKQETYIKTLQDQSIFHYHKDIKFALPLHTHSPCYLLIGHHLLHYLLQALPISTLILVTADMAMLLEECKEIVTMETSIDQPKHFLLTLALNAVFVKSLLVYRDHQNDIQSSHADQSGLLRTANPRAEFSELAISNLRKFYGQRRGFFNDFEMIVVDKELALGEVEGIIGQSLVILLQALRHLIGFLVLIVIREEYGLVLMPFLQFFALPSTEANDLYYQSPQYLPQSLTGKPWVVIDQPSKVRLLEGQLHLQHHGWVRKGR